MKLYTYNLGQAPYGFRLRAHAKAGALLLDVRRVIDEKHVFSARELMRIIPANYFRIKYFGDANQGTEGPVQLLDPARGYDNLQDVMKQVMRPSAVVLLCECSDPERCHLSVVAQYLIERGFAESVTSLQWFDRIDAAQPEPAAQPALIGGAE